MITFRIRELIEESKNTKKKVTQTALAKAAGISQASIWKIVAGKTKAPDPHILVTIAAVFTEALGREITIDDLIDKDDSAEKPESTRPPDEPPPEPRTIDDKIDGINEQLEGIRQEIAGVRSEIGKLNQRGGVN